MSVGENILKYWKYYAIVTAMVTIGTWLYGQGGVDRDIENRIFSTKEMKYETEKWMKVKPTALEEQRMHLLDSMEMVISIKNQKEAIKSRAKRDSLYLTEVKARKITDSIVLLNADQLYQIKEQLKRIEN